MSNRKLILAWGPAVVWMGMIFFLSSQSTLPTFPSIVPDRVAKKGAHFVEYATLAVLCWRALRQTIRAGNPATWAFALTVLYAMSDEWHQTFVPGRHGRLTDVLIDSTGAVVGLAAVHFWWRRKVGAGSARRPAPGIGTDPAGVRDPEVADGT
jgi:VanZ family protein